MKIVLVVPEFPKTSETFIVNKFLGLLSAGHDVHVVCQTSSSREWKHFAQLEARGDARNRVHVDLGGRPKLEAALRLAPRLIGAIATNPSGLTRYVVNAARERGLGALMALVPDLEIIRLKPDVVHFEFGPLARGRMHLKQWLGTRVIVSFRGYDLNFSGLDDDAYYADVWNADGLHFLGNDLLQRAYRRGCPSDRPHCLIPPAIDTAFFSPEPRRVVRIGPDRPVRILSVGRLEWKKGYEFGLSAIRMLRDRGVPLEYRIVGDGDHLEAVSFCRHSLGLDEHVTLLGALDRNGIRSQMQWADIFLHSAVSEGFCNAVIEAQAMALPVVTSDADGLAENVAEGETGFVVQRRDSQALAERLERLSSDETLRLRMGEAGRRRVTEHFQLKDQIAAFDRFYRRVHSGSAPHELASGIGIENGHKPEAVK